MADSKLPFALLRANKTAANKTHTRSDKNARLLSLSLSLWRWQGLAIR